MNDREEKRSSRTKTVMQIVMINNDDLFVGERLKALKGNRRRVSFVWL